MTRRDYLQMMAAGAAAARTVTASPAGGDADREQRMKWWHEARFGMFIHWGLYSMLGRHEWAMENEGIPVAEYEQLAKQFKPKPNAARDWARLAKQAGQKYMVMTTKHHEGFCHFDSKLTDYCAPKQGPGRDLVKEYVEAARAEGLRVGFYYSLMDWHHPDGARCATDEAARRRFVDYIHGQIRELLTNYGKIDVLWYDVSWPLDAAGWESEKMNAMVFQLQPEIIVNNRNELQGDFATPEQRITADQRAWESCMTMNDSWGYQPRRRQLEIAQDGGAQPDHLRARYRQLSAEHRSQRRWIDSGRVGGHSDHGRQMDGRQRHSPFIRAKSASPAGRHSPVSRARAIRSTCTSTSGRGRRWRWADCATRFNPRSWRRPARK